MKTCPQCNSVYGEDDVFCLTDGNALLEGDGEQETVLNQKFSMPPVETASESDSYCPSCGLANRANSKFCKKCGVSFTDGPVGLSPQSGFGHFGGPGTSSQPYNETVTFQSPSFTPPQTQTHTARPASNKVVIIALAVVGGILIVVVGMFGLGDSIKSLNKNAPNANNAVSVPEGNKSNLPSTFDRQYQGSIAGKALFMSLKRDGPSLTGTAQTIKSDTLSGKIEDNGEFQVDARENGGIKTGVFSGHIYNDGSISGQWTTPEGAKARSFSVQQQ